MQDRSDAWSAHCTPRRRPQRLVLKDRVSPARRLAAAVALGACMAGASALLAWGLDPALGDPIRAQLLWRNALPWFLIMLLLFGLSGRGLFALALGAVLGAAVYQINGLKEFQLDVPLLPGDLVLWQQLLTNADFFAAYAGHRLGWLLAALLLVALLLYAAWRLARRRWRPGLALRLMLSTLAALSLLGLLRDIGPWQGAYARAALPKMRLWDAMQSVQDVGFAAFFVRSLQEMQASAAQPSDPSAVVDFVLAHAARLDARRHRPLPQPLPDIVVIQSEAFFDPSRLGRIGPEGWLEAFRALARTGIRGNLRVSAYGGGTIRTEFETLTGYPMNAFPDVAYPYYGLAAAWMPSLPRRLAAFGYSAALYHPFREDFWNRRQVMPLLGFDAGHYEESFASSERVGPQVSDRALFDRLLQALEAETPAPRFLFGITMENHGPWSSDVGALAALLEDRPLPTGLSTAGARELTHYLAHLVNGDAALGDFARALLARSRWTVLVFYGDHLPNLPNAFADLGFADGAAATAQPSRYLIVSNRTLEPRELDISAFQLPGLLFDALGLPLDGYLAIQATRRELQSGDGAQADSDRLDYEAARIEVACGRALNAAGECP